MLAGKGSDQGELLSTRIICLPGNPKIHRERRKPQADYKHHTDAKKSALQHLSLPPTSWEPNVTTYMYHIVNSMPYTCKMLVVPRGEENPISSSFMTEEFPGPAGTPLIPQVPPTLQSWPTPAPHRIATLLLLLRLVQSFQSFSTEETVLQKDLQKDLAQKEDNMPIETWCAGPPWPGTHVSHHIISFSIETPLCGTALTEKSNKRFLLCFEMQ